MTHAMSHAVTTGIAVRGFALLFVTSMVGVAACASDEGASRGSGAGDLSATGSKGGAVRIAEDSFDAGCCQRRDLDLNKDGKPDAYQFSRIIDEQPVVVRKEVDINFDGKIDLVRDLSDKGELVDERLDNDFDGKIDLVVFFERGAIVRKEYDTNFDAKVDVWRFFDKGAMLREEADLDYNGQVDYWEYFEGGKLDRVGIDRNGDGNVDEWLNSSES